MNLREYLAHQQQLVEAELDLSLIHI